MKILRYTLLLLLCYSCAQATDYQISGLDDLTVNEIISPIDTGAIYQANNSVCVYSDNPQQTTYQVTIQPTNGSSQFNVSNRYHTIPIDIYWNNKSTAGGVLMPVNAPKAFSGASNTDLCGHIDNANLQFRLHGDKLNNATGGLYQGSFMVIIGAVG
tara:strand:+ start:35953 stop:36423 length:471 start_codon:yes stop_codon:yes gene_type:complete